METQGFEIAVTLRGKSINEVIEQAKALVEADGAPAGKTTRTRKAAASTVTDDTEDTDLLGSDDDTTDTEESEDQLSFDSTDDEEVEETKPAKKGKAPKITDKDVNAAALAHAKKHGRPKTLALLEKKFKVKSILELKPDQYETVIKALKV